MQTIRHWRTQATRYRLNELRPTSTDSEKTDITISKEVSKTTNRSVRELVVQPVPLAN